MVTKEELKRKKINEQKYRVSDFKDYLKLTSQMTLHLTLFDKAAYKISVVDMPYVHRWHPQYRNRVLARFYKITDWWENAGRPALTLLTLTTYQDGQYSRSKVGGYTIDDSLEILTKSWRKLRMLLRNRIVGHTFDYVYSFEMHESGYPHMHVAIVYEFTPEQQERVKSTWERYRAGSYKHGADFSENNDFSAKKDIKNLGFYLMKYLGKDFKNDPDKMNDAELRFNAAPKATNTRQWNTSRNLGKHMKLDSKKDENLEFISMGLSSPSILNENIREISKEDKETIFEEARAKLTRDLAIFEKLEC